MQSIAEELKQKTLAYWKLSRVWNGRDSREILTGEAIEICISAMQMTSNTRKIYWRFNSVMGEIVLGEGKGPHPHSEVVEFSIKAKATTGAIA